MKDNKQDLVKITVELTEELVKSLDRLVGTTKFRINRDVVIEEALCKWVVEQRRKENKDQP